MVDCVVKNWQGEAVGNTALTLKAAKEENAKHILHRAVVRQLNNARQGTASSKTRSEVRGGGRKPWRQKGTGRARAGSIRSPLWRGGGVIFGPKPRDYSQKMNKKERRLALRTALVSQAENLVVVEPFTNEFSSPKTKTLAEALGRWGVEPVKRALIILEEIPENIFLSGRNIPTLKLLRADSINTYDILLADTIIATASALEKIQEVFGD